MAEKYDITASMVLYQTDIEEIETVLEQFQKTTLSCKVYLIDNSPTDDLGKDFHDCKEVEYIFTGKNLGFGTGHNVAISRALEESEIHLVLNADIKFDHGILLEMRDYMKEHKDVGLLAPKILNFDGSLQYSAKLLPTPMNLIVRRFIPVKAIQDRLNYKYEFRFSSFDRIFNVPYVMGCFMFIKLDAIREVGGFDERFFMYPEDIDLTRRIHEKYRTLYFPKTTIFHKHGKGSYKNSKLLYYHVTSMIKYFNKWGWIFDRTRRKINKETLAQFEDKNV